MLGSHVLGGVAPEPPQRTSYFVEYCLSATLQTDSEESIGVFPSPIQTRFSEFGKIAQKGVKHYFFVKKCF